MSNDPSLRVLYDAQIFTSQKFGGISRYFVELMRNMPEDIVTDVAAKYSHNVYIRDVKPVPDFPGVPFKKDIVKALNNSRSRARIAAGDFDVFHPTYYNPYFLRQLKRPYVVTVHDMIHERFPESFSPSDPTARFKREIVERADHIIAISESTRRDLIDMYGLGDDRVSVVYHGATCDSGVTTPVRGLPERYILFVGDRNRYKNFSRLAEAFAAISSRYPELQLVCTGRPFNKHETAQFDSLGITSRVKHFFVSDSQLRYLYAHADLFVFPSLFEGFGFPVLESFAAGCPIVLSNTSSLPEIAGDGGVYFDPTSVDDMSDAIVRVLDDRDLRQAMTRRGHEIVKQFTWQRTATLTADIYRSLR